MLYIRHGIFPMIQLIVNPLQSIQKTTAAHYSSLKVSYKSYKIICKTLYLFIADAMLKAF